MSKADSRRAGWSTGARLATIGAVLQIGPVLGVGWSIYSLLQAFYLTSQRAPGPSLGAAADRAYSEQFLGPMWTGLWTMGGGISIGLVGLLLISIAMWGYGYRAKWFYRFMVIDAVAMLLLFPIGTAFGAAYLLSIQRRRGEFFPEEQAPA